MAIDWDEKLAYETPKIVRVRDRWLGVMRLFFLVGISLYIGLYSLWYKQGYLLVDTPEGNVRTTLMKEQVKTYPSHFPYCKQFIPPPAPAPPTPPYLDPKQCLVWEEYQMNYPPDMLDSMMVCTRVSISTQYRICQDLSAGCINPWSMANASNYYITHVEAATIMIEHSMTTQLYNTHKHNSLYAGSSRSLSGSLVNADDVTLMTFPPGRDIISIGTLLGAGDIDLGRESDAEGDAGQSMRYSGIVVLVYIEYTNLVNIQSEPTFKISVVRFPQAEHKTVQVIDTLAGTGAANPTKRVLYNRHGIKFVFLQGGTIAAFDWPTLMVSLASALGLLSVASLVVEMIMLNVGKRKWLYTRAKFIDTVEFGVNNTSATDDPRVVDTHSDLQTLRYANMNELTPGTAYLTSPPPNHNALTRYGAIRS